MNDPHLIDEDLNPGEYAFAEPPPPVRDGPPIHIGKFDHSEPEDDDKDERKTARRNAKREPAISMERHPLNRLPPEEIARPPLPWWFWAAVLALLGTLFLMASAALAASQIGAGPAVMSLGIAFVVVLIETVAITALLMVLGMVFGIDYGPVKEVMVRLPACVLLVNGLTLFSGIVLMGIFGLTGGSLACICFTPAIAILMYVVLQSQFQLSMNETLITIAAIESCAWCMAVGLGCTLLRELMTK